MRLWHIVLQTERRAGRMAVLAEELHSTHEALGLFLTLHKPGMFLRACDSSRWKQKLKVILAAWV